MHLQPGRGAADRQPAVVEKVCTAASVVLPHHTTHDTLHQSNRTGPRRRIDRPTNRFPSSPLVLLRLIVDWLRSTCLSHPPCNTPKSTFSPSRLRLSYVDYCMHARSQYDTGAPRAYGTYLPACLPACRAATGRGGWEPLRLGLVRLGQAELDTERRRRMCCVVVRCDVM
ncbi:hypothetical protein BC567DRAFT_19997 [Phyllosticta citribraziliensis]